MAVALLALSVAVITVYLDRDGYIDVRHERMSFLDCVYFATVSLTTTGYGDITPITESARLINILIITPLRIMFLVVLVGTTLQVLTERSRQAWKIQRWRTKVRNHTVVVGYGTKGKTAVVAVLSDETARRTSSSSTPTGQPSTTRQRQVWSPSTVTRPGPMCCGWPACSARPRSSWPPAATTPLSWSR